MAGGRRTKRKSRIGTTKIQKGILSMLNNRGKTSGSGGGGTGSRPGRKNVLAMTPNFNVMSFEKDVAGGGFGDDDEDENAQF